MPNNIRIDITGDKTLEKNVTQAKKIEKSINNAYEDWKKIIGSKEASTTINEKISNRK